MLKLHGKEMSSTATNEMEAIEAIRPDLEAFASLWSSLRANYQGTNITKTVARLLHMYQPEDGVLAYERLLRTLCVLLEDFDGNGLRLLVSMVPPPKAVSDQTIKQVFYKATGFMRLDAPIFHNNSNVSYLENYAKAPSNTKIEEGNFDCRASSPISETRRKFHNDARNLKPEGSTTFGSLVNSDASRKREKSPKALAPEAEVFRGFPSNEITNTQCHAKNATHFHPTQSAMNYPSYPSSQTYLDCHEPLGQSGCRLPDSSSYRLKWYETPMLVRKSNYDGTSRYPDLILKTSNNKYIRLPITKVNGPPMSHFKSTIQLPHQSYYPNDETHLINDTSGSVDFPNDLRSVSDANPKFQDTPKIDDSTNEKNMPKNATMKFVDNDYECTKFYDNFHVKENLDMRDMTSPNNEMMEKFREVVERKQRAIQEDIYRMDVVSFDDEIIQAPIEESQCLGEESLRVTDELKRSVKNFIKRVEEEESSEPSSVPRTRGLYESHDERSSVRRSPRILKNEKLVKNSTPNVAKTPRICSQRNLSKVAKSSEDMVLNPEPKFQDDIDEIHRSEAMTELGYYKKQYCDALMSIQRAKVAVANSLVISSSQSCSTNYDPRVLQYLQQQHQMLQQQERVLMSSQHSLARRSIFPSNYSNLRGGPPGLWYRPSNDYTYPPSCRQYTAPHQTQLVSSLSCTSRSSVNLSKELSKNSPCTSYPMHDKLSTRLPAKRRKLEEIVDKLKDNENM